jgi:hypothetical protein
MGHADRSLARQNAKKWLAFCAFARKYMYKGSDSKGN